MPAESEELTVGREGRKEEKAHKEKVGQLCQEERKEFLLFFSLLY